MPVKAIRASMRSITSSLLLMVLLAGCGQTGGQPTQSAPPTTPVATPTSPPVAGPTTESPPSSSSQDALYAEAERVYRAYVTARESYELTGEFNGFPPEMAEYLDTELYESANASYEEGRAGGWRLSTAPIYEIHPAPGVTEEDSVVALGICQDATAAVVSDRDGNVVSHGTRGSYYAFFRYADDGRLKLFRLGAPEEELCS